MLYLINMEAKMPRFDGTGPMGQGPGTGRGMGPCMGYRGRGFGFGRGMGFGRFISPKNELASLEEEAKNLETELAIIREEIKSIKDNQK